MEDFYSRTRLVLGDEGVEKLKAARVAVFGAGGVGGYAVEGLARAGVGALDIIDGDKIAPSNLNRQIIATLPDIGKAKADVAAERVKSINADCKVNAHSIFFLPGDESLDFSAFDYVVDAVDTVAAKVEIISRAKAAGTPVISCMGAGNKLDPTAFKVVDISKTSVCPLARAVRRELKKRQIEGVKVVYSEEEPKIMPHFGDGERVVGSLSFVPPVAGLIAAGEVIKFLAGIYRKY